MTTPEVSVVMSVYNGAQDVEATVESILTQQGVDLEFIIVNDGSTDDTASLLQAIAKTDTRLKLIDQENTGLTKALIMGCRLAKGRFVARQDAGDLSLATRLKSQYEALSSNTELTMVSTATEFFTPDEEFLYMVSQSEQDAENSLKQNDAKFMAGPPHHGSVMFRRDTYLEVGGYRPDFLVAQDIDLWVRLIEHGRHYSLPQVLYRATLHKNSISMSKRKQQLETVAFIIKSRQARAQKSSDKEVLKSLYEYNLSANKESLPKHQSDSSYYYYLGSCMTKNSPTGAIKYLRKAVKANPLNWRARIKLAVLRYRNRSHAI